jgi:hypothetical protein
MRLHIIPSLLACLLGIDALGQQEQNLHFSVDRPGIADLPTTVPAKHLQVETGLEYYRREHTSTYYLPTALLRYGIGRNTEVRVIPRFQRLDSLRTRESKPQWGMNQLSIAFKTVLFKEKGFLPATSLVTDVSIPGLGSKAFTDNAVGRSIYLLMENNLSERFLLNYNIGMIWNGSPTRLSEMYAICLEIELDNNRSAVFIEQSTTFNDEMKNDYWVDVGVTHLLSPTLQADFSLGADFNRGPFDYFIAMGLSKRFSLAD